MPFWNKKTHEPSELELERSRAVSTLSEYDPTDEGYKDIMAHVDKLSHLIDLEKDEKISPNTIAVIAGNALVAILVIGYERANVIATKAPSFMTKLTR